MEMFYQKAEKLSDPRFGVIEVGAVYWRQHETNVVDTAEILALKDDFYGVPHVHFLMTSRLHCKLMDIETKTLAVESFLTTFPAKWIDKDG